MFILFILLLLLSLFDISFLISIVSVNVFVSVFSFSSPNNEIFSKSRLLVILLKASESSLIILSIPSLYFDNKVLIKLSSVPIIILFLLSALFSFNKYEFAEVLFFIKFILDDLHDLNFPKCF